MEFLCWDSPAITSCFKPYSNLQIPSDAAFFNGSSTSASISSWSGPTLNSSIMSTDSSLTTCNVNKSAHCYFVFILYTPLSWCYTEWFSTTVRTILGCKANQDLQIVVESGQYNISFSKCLWICAMHVPCINPCYYLPHTYLLQLADLLPRHDFSEQSPWQTHHFQHHFHFQMRMNSFPALQLYSTIVSWKLFQVDPSSEISIHPSPISKWR